jgi:hypothetical protein
MYIPMWVLVVLLVGWYVYRYYQFKQKAKAAGMEAKRDNERLKALPGEWLDEADVVGNYRYTPEDIAKLLDAGGGARWHEEQAARLRQQIAAQGHVTERQRKSLAFHEESAAAIRLAAAIRGAPELADRP